MASPSAGSGSIRSAPTSIRKISTLLEDLDIDGVVLPKAECGDDVADLAAELAPRSLPIHAIVTETAASLFGLLSYRECCSSLAAMSWGAEDLSAALGASSKYAAGGELAFTYQMARSLCLAGAVAAEVQPVDGVFADFRDEAGLIAEARAAASEGFTGKLAIHPAQVGPINDAFTPSDAELDHARAIIDAFDAEPDAGVLVGRWKNGRPAPSCSGKARTGPVPIGGSKMATTAQPGPAETSDSTAGPTTAYAWGVEEYDTPLKAMTIERRALRNDDVAIRITHCGICHSDLHMAHNDWGMSIYPMVPGHEIVGIVTGVGPDVTKYKVGDRVAVGCLVDSCQKCRQCTVGP